MQPQDTVKNWKEWNLAETTTRNDSLVQIVRKWQKSGECALGTIIVPKIPMVQNGATQSVPRLLEVVEHTITKTLNARVVRATRVR